MKTIKVSEATGAALDWLVAQCEGYVDANDPSEHTDEDEALCYHNWCLMRDPGVAAKWLVDLAYSTNWSQGGPIIEREGILLRPIRRPGHALDGQCLAMYDGSNTGSMVQWIKRTDWPRRYLEGPTPLVAAMRCYVASRLGETVEVPEELP
jgi:hypothetical protein